MSSSPIVLYDGLCGFCDASVQWILRHDRPEVFRFAALQGETAAAVLKRHPEVPANLDSLILVVPETTGERLYWRSAAVLQICARLPGVWRLFAAFRVLPRPFTDLAYRFIAAIRYRIWGRRESCRIPSPGERARFLA
jgi:predicted DCC family thiol-disulfide oxidoreductase YuxK